MGIQLLSGTGKRRHARLRVRLPAKLITLAGEFRVVLCDLSTSGARVGKPGLALNSGHAVLQWDRFEAFCILAWCRGGLIGAQFDEPIPKEWIIATRELDEAEPLPDDEQLKRNAARDWVSGQLRL